MNIKQRIVLLIGALIFVGLGLYAPWHDKGSKASESIYGSSNIDVPAPVVAAEYDYAVGYALIFRPPEGATIDLSRLAVEWACLAVITGSLICVLRVTEKD